MRRRLRNYALVLASGSVAIVDLSSFKPALGADKTWVGPAGGSWSTPANWNPVGEPQGGSGTLGDNVVFEPGDSSTYTFDGNYSAALPLNSLQFGSIQFGNQTMVQSTGTLASNVETFDSGSFVQNGGVNSATTLSLAQDESPLSGPPTSATYLL